MRFLIGLLAGGALVLVLMQQFPLNSQQLLAETERVWHALVERGERVAGPPIRASSQQLPQDAPPVPVALPEPTLSVQDAGRAPRPDSVQSPIAIDEGGSQPVWAPFHSQRSAEGFARSLADALARPFDVRREGPGHYEVLFSYDDEQDRQDVLRAMTERMGAAF